MNTIGNAPIDSTARGGVAEVENPTFTEASERANIVSGESIPTLFGKIKKFFTDLKTVAFSGSYTDLSNKPTIPTDNSQLANGSGYITSAGSCASATKATQDENGNNISSTYVKKSGDSMTGDLVARAHIKVDRQNGTTSSVGNSYVMIGNNIPSGTAKNSKGILRLYSNETNYVQLLSAPSLTENINVNLPDKNGNVQVNNSITDLEDILLPHSNVTPTSSGKTTLLKYIQDVVIPKSSFIYGFPSSTFTDLPSTDWGYDIIVIKLGGIFVLCSRQQSEGIMYIRNINASEQWTGSWKQL